MSMLAGPRVKQKVINLRAKNSAWSNDKNKFGQKMLEKMGWSEGKGLGVKENGIVEHVVARYKNDDKGLGYVDRNDQWTKHEDDFNALLANLTNATSNEDIIHSGNSLEKKSKSSKARIHYHKFTRGKDLSRYSEKDLANIFGKKSFKNDMTKDDKNILNDNRETVIFTEKGSMDEYFKNKLAALKIKRKLPCEDDDSTDQNMADYAFQGFKNVSHGNDEYQNGDDLGYSVFFKSKSVDTEGPSYVEEPEIKRKKKKSKSYDKTQNLCETDEIYKLPTSEQETKTEISKNNITEVNEISNDANCDSLILKKKKNKKSKKKDRLLHESSKNVKLSEPEECVQLEKCTNPIAEINEPFKNKRKYNKNVIECVSNKSHIHSTKSKKKKNKNL